MARRRTVAAALAMATVRLARPVEPVGSRAARSRTVLAAVGVRCDCVARHGCPRRVLRCTEQHGPGPARRRRPSGPGRCQCGRLVRGRGRRPGVERRTRSSWLTVSGLRCSLAWRHSTDLIFVNGAGSCVLVYLWDQGTLRSATMPRETGTLAYLLRSGLERFAGAAATEAFDIHPGTPELCLPANMTASGWQVAGVTTVRARDTCCARTQGLTPPASLPCLWARGVAGRHQRRRPAGRAGERHRELLVSSRAPLCLLRGRRRAQPLLRYTTATHILNQQTRPC